MRGSWRAGIFAGIALSAVSTTALGQDYPSVVPGHRLEFPADEGSHPAFRTEWWYVTGWLEADDGEPLGFQVTFFRSRPEGAQDNPSRFAPRQLLFAHVAISDPRRGRLLRDEKAAREGFGLAGARTGVLDVHIDDWKLSAAGDGVYRATIAAREVTLELELRATQPPLLHGEEGFSQKSPDPRHASYYYSLVHLDTTGRMKVGGRSGAVRGVAWLDHEWWSEALAPGAVGWDWVGLNLDDGSALATSRVRSSDGTQLWAGGTTRIRDPTGVTRTTYAARDVEWTPQRRWRSPATGTEYPVEWRVRVGARIFVLRPLFDDQENDARGST